jgi:hypothetical protein
VKTAGSGGAAQGPAPTPHADDPVPSSAAYGRQTLEHLALTAPPTSGAGPPERGTAEVTPPRDQDP